MQDCPVIFDPVEHKYTEIATGRELISCSKLLSKLKQPFDPDGSITANYARKNKMTVEEVKAEWKLNNQKACDYGTDIHSELEHYIATKQIRESQYQHFVEQFSRLKYVGKLFSERMLYSLEHMVAGTADLIELGAGGLINLIDFKTNKKLEKYSPWGKKMLHEVAHLSDCNFNAYQLQLSIYGYLCELKNLKVNRLTVLYFNPKTQQMEPHDCKYMRKEVIEILKHKSYLK